MKRYGKSLVFVVIFSVFVSDREKSNTPKYIPAPKVKVILYNNNINIIIQTCLHGSGQFK